LLTELLLDDLEDFLLIELLGQALYSGQSLTTIALWKVHKSEYDLSTELWCQSGRTLNPYVDVVLRLLSLASVFVGFGEGVCISSQYLFVRYHRFLLLRGMADVFFILSPKRTANIASSATLESAAGRWRRWQRAAEEGVAYRRF